MPTPFKEHAHLAAARGRERALGGAVLDDDAPTARLADDMCATHGMSFHQAHERVVVEGFGGHRPASFLPPLELL
jgi:hypothetical protein